MGESRKGKSSIFIGESCTAVFQPNLNVGDAQFTGIETAVYVCVSKNDAPDNRLLIATAKAKGRNVAEALVESHTEHGVASQLPECGVPKKDVRQRRLQRQRVSKLPVETVSKELAVGAVRESLVLMIITNHWTETDPLSNLKLRGKRNLLVRWLNS